MWKEENNSLRKTYQFPDFPAAMAFMTRVAFIAEKINHHPDWRNVYNRVDVILSTHDAGNTVTELDRELAAAMDAVYSKSN